MLLLRLFCELFDGCDKCVGVVCSWWCGMLGVGCVVCEDGVLFLLWDG